MKVIDWFRPQESVVVVELPPNSPIKDDEDTIATLASHPGFLMLIQRLKLQRALIDAKLRTQHHIDIREVDSLQSGVHWLGYLEDTINKIILKKNKPAPQVPTDDLNMEFQRIRAGIESA